MDDCFIPFCIPIWTQNLLLTPSDFLLHLVDLFIYSASKPANKIFLSYPHLCSLNVCVLSCWVKSWLFCDPMDCSLPGSSVHGISQSRILEWLPFPPPGNLPNSGIEPVPLVPPALAGGFFTTEPLGKSLLLVSSHLKKLPCQDDLFWCQTPITLFKVVYIYYIVYFTHMILNSCQVPLELFGNVTWFTF